MTAESNSPIPVEKLIDLEITRHLRLEADGLHNGANDDLGKVIQPVGKRLSPSQIHGLLNRANTAQDVGSVGNYIQNQACKRDSVWKAISADGVLMNKINSSLRSKAQEIANQIKATLESRKELSQKDRQTLELLTSNRGRWQQIHLSLVQQYIQAFSSGYLYRTAPGSSRAGGSGNDDTPRQLE